MNKAIVFVLLSMIYTVTEGRWCVGWDRKAGGKVRFSYKIIYSSNYLFLYSKYKSLVPFSREYSVYPVITSCLTKILTVKSRSPNLGTLLLLLDEKGRLLFLLSWTQTVRLYLFLHFFLLRFS